jgi:hypothetical protein
MTYALKPLFAGRSRTLQQAAHAAFEIAATEELPIRANYHGDPETWHRECILKTVPVYGTRGRRCERVPATAQIWGDHAEFESEAWSKLTVKDPDFRRYLDWLHSLW